MFLSKRLEEAQKVLMKRREEVEEFRRSLVATRMSDIMPVESYPFAQTKRYSDIDHLNAHRKSKEIADTFAISPDNQHCNADLSPKTTPIDTTQAISSLSEEELRLSNQRLEAGQALLFKRREEFAELKRKLSESASNATNTLEHHHPVQTEAIPEDNELNCSSSSPEISSTFEVITEYHHNNANSGHEIVIATTKEEILRPTHTISCSTLTIPDEEESLSNQQIESPRKISPETAEFGQPLNSPKICLISEISLEHHNHVASSTNTTAIAETTATTSITLNHDGLDRCFEQNAEIQLNKPNLCLSVIEISYDDDKEENDCEEIPWDQSLPSPIESNFDHQIINIRPKILPPPPPTDLMPETIPFYPSLCSAMLHKNNVHIGRIWFLLRAMDWNGSGKINLRKARPLFTSKNSEWRVCGWRQFRHLLQIGQDIFWVRDKTTVWLRSAVKVAAALGVERFCDKPILLKTKELIETIGDVRATFYSAFHGGRQSKPIARDTLYDVCGVKRDSQRNYEKRSEIEAVPQFTVSYESPENASHHHGSAVFRFTDHYGKLGPKGKVYFAWQLPNRYEVAHTQLSKRYHRRLNRKLNVLLNTGTTGNGQWKKRQFYHEMKDALRATGERYYPTSKQNVWYAVSGRTLHE